jgi:non-ribosomal peptide synthetase component F
LALPKRLGDELKALSRQEGVTLFMALLAVFQALLHRYTGQDDIVVGTPVAGRDRAELEGLIGFFVNTLVLRTNLSGNPSFRQLLGRVREVALGAYTHQDLPFEKLVETLHPERNMSHQPLFQVMFVLQQPLAPLRLPDQTLSLKQGHAGMARFDLTFMVADSADGLAAVLDASTDLFDDSTISRMLEHFRILLEAVVADPDRPLLDIPLVPEEPQAEAETLAALPVTDEFAFDL